jgi:hypothetical protein
MPPTLLLFGTRPWLAAPLPVVLLWPLLALALPASLALRRTRFQKAALALAAAPRLFRALSGLRVQVEPRRGPRVYLTFV